MRKVLALGMCLSAAPLSAAENQSVDILPPALARSADLAAMLTKSSQTRFECDVFDLTVSPTFISGHMTISHMPPGPLVISVRASPLSFEYTDMNVDGVIDHINLSGKMQPPRIPELLERGQLEQEFRAQVAQNRAGIQTTFIVAVEHAIECVAGGRPNAVPSSL